MTPPYSTTDGQHSRDLWIIPILSKYQMTVESQVISFLLADTSPEIMHSAAKFFGLVVSLCQYRDEFQFVILRFDIYCLLIPSSVCFDFAQDLWSEEHINKGKEPLKPPKIVLLLKIQV